MRPRTSPVARFAVMLPLPLSVLPLRGWPGSYRTGPDEGNRCPPAGADARTKPAARNAGGAARVPDDARRRFDRWERSDSRSLRDSLGRHGPAPLFQSPAVIGRPGGVRQAGLRGGSASLPVRFPDADRQRHSGTADGRPNSQARPLLLRSPPTTCPPTAACGASGAGLGRFVPTGGADYTRLLELGIDWLLS